MPRDLTNFFFPKSIAIIGASRTPEKVGAIVLKNIIDSKYNGQIYPINPNTDNIDNLKCYPEISALPQIPDLAVIALPAPLVLEILNTVGEKGIKNVVVFSAGFKEIGPEGEKLEKDLINIAEKYQINLLGPNCLGFVNNLCPINATFGQMVNQSGNLRFIMQSGAIAASFFDWCNSTNLGLSEFVTLGNKAVINENDILEYYKNSPALEIQAIGLSNVRPIGLYLESISNGQDFIKITSEISKKDPIFIIKPGKTKAAAKAMQSHTGSIAGEDDVLEAALSQANILRCQTLEDFFDLSRAFAWENAPEGPRVAIISNAGGPAVISADAVISEGLELAEFSQEIKEELSKVLPRSASLINPVDVLGDALADRFEKACEIIFQTNQADSLVVILTPQVMTQIEKTAELIGKLTKKYNKPIFCSFIGGGLIEKGEIKLNEYRIPSFRFPERAIAAIGTMWKFKKQQKKEIEKIIEPFVVQEDLESINQIIKEAERNNQKNLDNLQSNRIVEYAGISTPATDIINDFEQAKSFVVTYSFPVVLKLSSEGLLHKRDLGAVITDITNEDELKNAFEKIQQIKSQLQSPLKENAKIQIQKDIANGVEVIVGIKTDSTFGKALLFGAGGTLAELILDRNLALLPINLTQAKKLVEKSKIFSILKGYRGGSSYALNKLYDLIVRLAKLAENLPQVTEIEVNPVIVTLDDAFAVDTKVLLKEKVLNTSIPNFHKAKVLEHNILAGTYHAFTFEAKDTLVYKPGQYISVKVANDRINAYSISGHSSNNIFNILVDISPGGPGSIYFQNLKPGDEIYYLGPFGIFHLNQSDGSKHLYFLGTGSGCSPLKCVIESALKENNLKTPITLYFGLRNPSDIFWQDYFQKLSDEHPNFDFKLVISKPNQTWQGLTGHITDLINNEIKDASQSSAYLCGNKQIIEEAQTILISHGCKKEMIYFEKF